MDLGYHVLYLEDSVRNFFLISWAPESFSEGHSEKYKKKLSANPCITLDVNFSNPNNINFIGKLPSLRGTDMQVSIVFFSIPSKEAEL